MIEKIGVIFQDVISVGFLKGLKQRLGCTAALIRPLVGVGNNQFMTRRQKQIACEYFRSEGVDLVVRFTDADRKSWRDVQRAELEGFPPDFEQRFICGVAVDNPEDWLAIAPEYLLSRLPLDATALRGERRSGAIKRAIARARGAVDTSEDIACRLVTEAPHDVFRRWLQDDAFGQFYRDCHRIAASLGCEPKPINEL